jgi:hypothetical protein
MGLGARIDVPNFLDGPWLQVLQARSCQQAKVGEAQTVFVPPPKYLQPVRPLFQHLAKEGLVTVMKKGDHTGESTNNRLLSWNLESTGASTPLRGL